MARKKNLAGLAALAGLAYMASRNKAVKGEEAAAPSVAAAPSTSTAAEMDPLEAANASPESQKIMEDAVAAGNIEKGGRMLNEMRDAELAPKRSLKPTATRSIAAPKLVTPEEGARAYSSRAPAADPREALMRNYVPRRDPRASGAMSGDYMANSAKSRGVRNMYERGAEEEGMKKGGSVKGWGIARGARKARTY